MPHAQLPPSRVQGQGSTARETRCKGVLRLGVDREVLFLAAGMGDRRRSQTMEENVDPHHGLQGPASVRTLKGDRPGGLAGARACQGSYS